MKKQNTLSYIKILISWGLMLLWMGVIFYLSAQVADDSSELSSGVTTMVSNTIQSITPFKIDLDVLHFLVRKGAHFTAYFILGFLVLNAIRTLGAKPRRDFITALLICVLYAISDEVHQLFVPGRSGQVTDVMIDSLGAITGLGVFKVVRWYFK